MSFSPDSPLFNPPEDYEPDIGLAVDLGRKAFEDARDAIGRNVALMPGPVEGGIVIMVAANALKAWAEMAVMKTDPEGSVRKAWEGIASVFAMSNEEVAAKDRPSGAV